MFGASYHTQRETVDRISDLIHEIGLPFVPALEKICGGHSGSRSLLPMPVIGADPSPPTSALPPGIGVECVSSRSGCRDKHSRGTATVRSAVRRLGQQQYLMEFAA